MSQQVPGGLVKSFQAAATLSANRIVALSAANQVGLWNTTTAMIIGVTLEDSRQTGQAIAVALGGTVKVLCNASVSAGAIVGPDTNTGAIIERANAATNTAKTLGIALEAGSTNSVIEVALQIKNSTQA